jgi:4-hydroxy-tetrahydrodipicolinate reductase
MPAHGTDGVPRPRPRLLILGPSGRMGRALLDAAANRGDLAVAAAVDRDGAPGLHTEVAPGVRSTTDLGAGLAACDVYIDFTAPAATTAAARAARERARAAVVGTTGLGVDAERAIAQLAEVAPVVVAANFSLGVNVVLGLVERAARALATWDAEVSEIHHKAKRDAPSGTAIAVARAIAAGRGVEYDRVRRHTRDGDVGPRGVDEIGVMAVRGGDVIGEHTAYFFGEHERVEIAHKATSRDIFAVGALHAAAWAAGQPPGRYDMLDVLGLR